MRGILSWRMPVQGVMQSVGSKVLFKKSPIAGFPDIAGLYRGVFFAFEVKTSVGRLSDLQLEWIEALGEHGAMSCKVVSVECVEKALNVIDERVDSGTRNFSSSANGI